jgi:short-subunit dehydrogenase
MAKVAGERVLLTGASSGIGAALARELGRRGTRLALAARRVDRLEALAAEVEAEGGPRPVVLEADLSVRGAAAGLAERALGALGDVDVLVNNAGGGVGGAHWAVGDGEAARDAYEVNFWSPVALAAALVPRMRERGDGVVVNVTSLAQVLAMWSMGHYASTKAALGIATQSLRLELHGSGVHVLQVVPGPVDTAVQAETRLVPGAAEALARAPLGTPEDLAPRVVRAIERRRKTLVYPRRLAAVYALPFLGRRNMTWLVRRLSRDPRFDPAVPLAVRTGSHGDETARAARAEWEARAGA